MKITILNGNPNKSNDPFENYLEKLTKELSETHECNQLLLREMSIIPCTGCFGCWVKTPGQCVVKDETIEACREYISSDLVIYASPVIMGFTSALLKTVQDKFIPLIHPYFERVKKEIHHQPRYDSYPQCGLILQEEPQGDSEDIEIIKQIYERACLNLKSDLIFTSLTNKPTKELTNEINSF